MKSEIIVRFRTIIENIIGLDKTDTKSLFKNVSIAFALKIINVIIVFVYNLTLAKLIGAEGVGVYFIAFSVSSIVSVISTLGLNNPLIKFVSTNSTNKNWSKVKGVSKLSIQFSLLTSTVLTIILYIITPEICKLYLHDQALINPIRIMIMVILPMTIISLIQDIFKGLGKYKLSLILQGIMVPLLAIPLLFLLSNKFSTIGAVWAFLISNTITCLFGVFLLIQNFKDKKEYVPTFDKRLLLNTALPFLLIAITNIAVSQGDIIILGFSSQTNEIGAYGIAKKLSTLIVFILFAINTISSPKFASYFENHQLDKLKDTAQYFSLIAVLFTTPIFLFIYLFSNHIMAFMGESFVGYGYILVIFAFAQYINVSAGSVGAILNMTGYEKIVLNYSLILIILTLIFSIIAIYFGKGIFEVAIIFSLNIIIKNILGVLYVKKLHGFYVLSPSSISKIWK